MRVYKILLVSLTVPAILLSQQDNYSHSEKTHSTPFLIQANNEPAQQFRQELNQIINKINNTKLITEYYLIDSLIAESVDGWKFKYLFDYNNKGKIIERIAFFEETGGDWQIDYKEEYFYDIQSNLVRAIFFSWNSVTWDSVFQNLYNYNKNNNLVSTTLQSYIPENWENDARTTYTYDKSGNEITSLTELWQNNQWTNSSVVYSYYSPENRRDSLLLQNWDGNNWQNYWRTSFYYDSLTTFLKLAIAQLWTGSQFQDSFKLNIINDELGNQIQQLEEIWNGVEWVNDIKKDYTYVWNYFESCNAELWNGTNWGPGDTQILVDNPDGFKIAIVTHRISIYYIIVNVETPNSDNPSDFSLSQNYPNPFNPSTVISYRLPVNGFVTLKVYDLLGSEVATLVNEEKPAGEYEVEFNAVNLLPKGSLTSGIYFYRLQAGEFIQTKKMILLK